ncbi:hypothetical protein ACHHYP_00702 [Achlya hypogyna]|uniref:Cell wall-active antibiotics response LiaF-like C-terminal domain-containing protein n=1 Tax=Achlya hypogyna TaxID=1202772 RepID=A0A1V9ZU35_ACHHY|nr:hypothetical protein ACHHYP_00702 [Achlya hypogyna]
MQAPSMHQAQYLTGESAHIQTERESHKMGFGGGTLFISAGSFINAAGPIVVPKRIVITVVLKGATIDLTQATFVHPVTEIKICAVLGGVKLVLPQGVRCEASGLSIFGAFRNATTSVSSASSPAAPLVRITGISVMGGAKASVSLDAAPLAVVPSSPPQVEVTVESESVPYAMAVPTTVPTSVTKHIE